MEPSQHYLNGMLKVKENDFAAAIELFTAAINENPEDVESYSERAVCYIHLEKLDLSLFDMNKSVELDPNYSYRYSCRAYLKGKMKDMQGAVDDYQRAVELDPQDIVAHNNLGIAQENLGYYKKAQKSFDKSNELLGYDPENREIVGDVAMDKEEAAKVKEEEQKDAKKVEQKKRRRVIMDVFSKKGEFRGFMKFIGNGFKMKNDDKEGES